MSVINCNDEKCRIDCKNVVYRVFSRLWCSGSTAASQASGEGSIPFSRSLQSSVLADLCVEQPEWGVSRRDC